MRLIEASADQAAARDGLCHAAWGTPLTVEQFRERELVLRSHRWPRSVMKTWLWVDAADQVLSSCETFHMPPVFAIASVFTEASLRGHGHAEAMLTALHSRLNDQPTILFSEIGPKLYERVGYRGVPSFDVLFDAAKLHADVEWRLRLPAFAPSADLRVTFTLDQLDWHHERARYYARVLNRTVPNHWGATCGDSAIGWTANYRLNELVVLFTRGSELNELLNAARATAHSVGLTRVRIWETSPIEGGTRVTREDLPMHRSSWAHWSSIDRAVWV